MHTTTAAFNASTTTARAGFLSLAAAITLGLLASVGGLADQRYDDALMAQASQSAPMQVVVVTGQRLPRV